MELNIEEVMKKLDPRLRIDLELEAMTQVRGGSKRYRSVGVLNYANLKERKALIQIYQQFVRDSGEQYVKNPREIPFR